MPAILARGALVTPAGRFSRLREDWNLDDVAFWAADLGETIVYSFDGIGASKLLLGTEAGAGWVEAQQPGRWRVRGGVCTVLDVAVTEPRWLAMGPGDLRRMFVLLDAAGIPWQSSPGTTVDRLIISTHPREKGGTQLSPPAQIPPPALHGNLEMPYVSWGRPLIDAEARARFVHTYDANAQYLAAWQAAELPMGTPTMVTGTPDPDRPVPPGLWHVRWPSRVATDWASWPIPSPVNPEAAEWITSQTLTRVREYAEVFPHLPAPEVVEGWVYPGSSRYLRPAAERMRNVRARAQQVRAAMTTAAADATELRDAAACLSQWVAADAAADAVKDLYTRGTGRFAWGGRPAGSALYRPDWRHVITATARTNMHRAMSRWTRAPFAVATDAVAFATDEPDPVAFAARAGIRLGAGLGEWKRQGTAPAGDVLDLPPLDLFRAVTAMRGVWRG